MSSEGFDIFITSALGIFLLVLTILFLLLVFVIAPAIVIPISIYNGRHRAFVNENSVALYELSELNKKYRFKNVPSIIYRHAYDNPNFYDDISCKDYLTYQLVYIRKEVEDKIDTILNNRHIYKFYKEDIERIKVFGRYKQSADGLNKNKLLKIEKKYFEQLLYTPTLDFHITVALRREKINGEVIRRKKQTFNIPDILNIIDGLSQRRGKFYLNDDIWQSICRVERGKVSNRLRFAIYARDGYRCKKCGARDRGDNLEIDHIFPISKGGKSNPENLQTLCWKCNKAKGNKIY